MSNIWCDNCRQSVKEGVTVIVDPIHLKTVDVCINCAKYFLNEKQHPSYVGVDKTEPALLKDVIASSDTGLRDKIKEQDKEIADLKQEIFMLRAQLKTQKPKETKHIPTMPTFGEYKTIPVMSDPTFTTVPSQNPFFPTWPNQINAVPSWDSQLSMTSNPLLPSTLSNGNPFVFK